MAPRGSSKTLSIVIAGDNSGARKAMAGTETGAKSMGKTVGGVAAGIGAALAGGAIVRFGRQAIDTYRSVGAEMLQIQRLTGASEESASGLWVAAQQSGVEITKLTTGLRTLATKAESGALEKWGIAAKDAEGNARSFDDILGDVIDRYGELDGVSRTAFASGIFGGRSGGEIMKILGQGREAMAGFVEEAKRLGIELDSETLKQATANQRDFELALTASKAVIGKELLPAVTQMTTVLANNMPAIATAVGSVASAFNALPKPLQGTLAVAIALGPAMRLLSVALGPLQAGLSSVAGVAGSVRAGLTGMGQAGGAATSGFGALASSVAASPAAMAAAAVGIGVVIAALIKWRQEADETKQAAKNLASEAVGSGQAVVDVFRDQLARSLNDLDEGLKGFDGSVIGERMKALGISGEELFNAISRGGPAIEEMAQRLSQGEQNSFDFEESVREISNELEHARGAYLGAANQAAGYQQTQQSLGIATGQTADATAGAADAEEDYGAAVTESASATQLATAAQERRNKALQERISAQQSVVSAEAGTADALVELADAQQALADVDEIAAQGAEDVAAAREAQADAADAVTDAYKSLAEANAGIGEAERGVGDALRDVYVAQVNLTEARRDAAEAIDEMAEAARNAAVAESGAQVAVMRAQKELDRFLNSGERGDAVKEAELRQALLEAQNNLTNAQDETADSAAAAAQAQAAGVEGSREVQDAQRQLADAHRGVADAQQEVVDAKKRAEDAAEDVKKAEENEADAAKNTADVQRESAERTAAAKEEAAQRVVDAEAAVNQAKKDQIDAEAELLGVTQGVGAAIQYKIDKYAELAGLLAPGSPLRQNLEWLIAELGDSQRPGLFEQLYGQFTRDSPSGNVTDNQTPGWRSGRGMKGPVVVNQYLNGSAAHERRLLKDNAEDILNRQWRAAG